MFFLHIFRVCLFSFPRHNISITVFFLQTLVYFILFSLLLASYKFINLKLPYSHCIYMEFFHGFIIIQQKSVSTAQKIYIQLFSSNIVLSMNVCFTIQLCIIYYSNICISLHKNTYILEAYVVHQIQFIRKLFILPKLLSFFNVLFLVHTSQS